MERGVIYETMKNAQSRYHYYSDILLYFLGGL
jgi:hypothetical protein